MQKNSMFSSKFRKLQLASICVAVIALAGCSSTKVDEQDLIDVAPTPDPIVETVPEIEEEEIEEEIEEEEVEEEIEEEEVEEEIEEVEEEEESPVETVSTSSETTSSSTAAVTTTATTTTTNNIENVSASSNVTLPTGYQEKFKDWYAVNTDLRGWIKLAGTKLDYPVMQTTNDSYYLNRNAYKQSDVWGVPYMSTYCTTDVSTNTVLYGHSRDATGEQLSALKGYRKIDFYKANPVIEFDTVYADGDYKIIAYFIENTSESRSFFRYHQFINQTDPDYINNFIAQAKARSYINTTVDYNTSDKFLTISTCEDTNASNFNRLVLVARKVRPGESSYVDTSGATQNTAQVLP